MRIGIEAQRLFRKKKHGMEVVALELINHLQTIDRENEYVIFVREDEDHNCIQETPNFKVKKISSYTFADWEQYQLPKAIKEENIDFLHCTSNTAPLFLKIPLLVTIHDIIYLESINFGGTAYQNFGNIYRRIVVPYVAKKAKKIITVSEFERRNIIAKLKVPEDKIQTVYNAKSLDFKPVTDALRLQTVARKYNLPPDFLFFFGNTSPRKNTDGILKAYADYVKKTTASLPLVITAFDITEIKALLQKNNIDLPEAAEKIKCIGYIDKEDLPVLYNLASVYLYPSFREGFGLPIIEAMACGVPVITSNVSSMPEVAGEAALLVDPTDVEAISAAIIKLTKNNTFKQEQIRKGIIRAQRFDWKKTAEETLAVYRQMKEI